MHELVKLMAPGKKRIVGVLETMKVYQEITDKQSAPWVENGVIHYYRDYGNSKLHHVDKIEIFIDEDGHYWLARDLFYMNKTDEQATRPSDDGFFLNQIKS